MQRMRTKRNRRLGVGLAMAGLLCQLVLSLVHVPGALASQSINETGKIVTVICTPNGFKRVVFDVASGQTDTPANAPVNDYDDLSLSCAVCLSLSHIAVGTLPDELPFLYPTLIKGRVGLEPRSVVTKSIVFRASQRAPPVQA